MVEADTGPHDDTAAPQSVKQGTVHLHLVPDDDGVGARPRLGGNLAWLALAENIPVDMRAGGVTLDHSVVGILRVGGQQPEVGHEIPRTRL
jgi:hypothetical protein